MLLCILSFCWLSVNIATNVSGLASVGDFGALHCQPSTNVDRSTSLDLTTSAPIAANGCWSLALFYFCLTPLEYFSNNGAIG